MIKSTFSERLNFIIKERGIRQKDLCLQTGISKSAMSQYLRGSFEPKQQKLHLLAVALNVSEAWLMGYDVPRERIDLTTSPVMEVIVPDNSMADAHIPMGAVVSVVPLDTLCAGDFTDDLCAADGKIICWSSDDMNCQLRYLHIGNGTFILTAADPGVAPEVFTFSDLDSGKLVIHGVVQKVVINF